MRPPSIARVRDVTRSRYSMRALRCLSRRAAMRRGLVRLRVNRWRAVPRIATQMLAVGARSSEALMRKQWCQRCWERVLVTANLKCKVDAEDKCIAARHVEQRTTPRAKPSDARAASFDLARRDALAVCSSWRRGRGGEGRRTVRGDVPNAAKSCKNANAMGTQNGDQK